MLIITPLPPAQLAPADLDLAHKHRFECRTCPYQMLLDRKYYERKTMALKAAEDVLGGEGSWANVDRSEGAFALRCVAFSLPPPPSIIPLLLRFGVLMRGEIVRCKNENCDSTQAYFRQVQIRSADEPMTTFYKCVKCNQDWREN